MDVERVSYSPTDCVMKEVSLDQAQAFITRLKAENKRGAQEDPYGRRNRNASRTEHALIDVNNNLSSSANLDDFKTKVRKAMLPFVQKFNRKNRLNLDIVRFKDAIHRANATVGIDSLLSQKDYFTELRTVYQTMYDQLEHYRDQTDALDAIYTSYLKTLEHENASLASTNVPLYNVEQIEAYITEINQMLTKLDQQIKQLNTNTMVSVCLSNESVKILGL